MEVKAGGNLLLVVHLLPKSGGLSPIVVVGLEEAFHELLVRRVSDDRPLEAVFGARVERSIH